LWDSKAKAEIDARIERELDEDQKFAEESPLPDAKTADQGVYCEGCHMIEADWRRPKEQVTPPAASVEAVWKVVDFGAAAAPPGAAPVTQAKHQHKPAQHQQQPSQHGHHRPAQSPTPSNGSPEEERAVAQDVSEAPPLRVPFGRGPKDRAFEREQKPNQPPKHTPHRRRRR
jgi:hypothetical protein